jgi:hypothetical protein
VSIQTVARFFEAKCNNFISRVELHAYCVLGPEQNLSKENLHIPAAEKRTIFRELCTHLSGCTDREVIFPAVAPPVLTCSVSWEIGGAISTRLRNPAIDAKMID